MNSLIVFGGLRRAASAETYTITSSDLNGMTGPQKLAVLDAMFLVVMIGCKCRIFTWEESDGALIPAFYSPRQMASHFKDHFLTHVDTIKGVEKTTKVALFPYWKKQSSALRAWGCRLAPEGGRIVEGQANLWCGLGRTPKAGGWPLLRAHIEEMICSNDSASIAYLFKWLAWTLQNPAEPSEVVVVLRGLGDAGRDILARVLLHIFASHGLKINQIRRLTCRQNLHLLLGCFGFLEEAPRPGSEAATLKRLASESTRIFRGQGFDFDEFNHLSMMMSVKEDWEDTSPDDEGQFAIFNVSNVHRGDRAYLYALAAEIVTGGAEAFLADMLAMDLGDWHPSADVPATLTRRGQK